MLAAAIVQNHFFSGERERIQKPPAFEETIVQSVDRFSFLRQRRFVHFADTRARKNIVELIQKQRIVAAIRHVFSRKISRARTDQFRVFQRVFQRAIEFFHIVIRRQRAAMQFKIQFSRIARKFFRFQFCINAETDVCSAFAYGYVSAVLSAFSAISAHGPPPPSP